MPIAVQTQHYPKWIHRVSGTLLGDSAFNIDKRGSGTSYRLYFQHTNIDYFNHKIKLLNLDGTVSWKRTGYGSLAKRFVSTALTNSHFPVTKFYYTGHTFQYGRKLLKYNTLSKLIDLDALALWIADDGSLGYNNKNKFTPRLILNTQNCSMDQMREYEKYFNKKYHCTPMIGQDKRVKTFGYYLIFNTKDSLFILNYLKNKQIKGMEYKFYFPTEGYLE